MNRKLLGVMFVWSVTIPAARADDDPPLALTRDGFFYVGGHATMVNGHSYVVGQIVRGDAHPGEPDASVSDHHGAWRNADRHHLYRHSGRAGESAAPH